MDKGPETKGVTASLACVLNIRTTRLCLKDIGVLPLVTQLPIFIGSAREAVPYSHNCLHQTCFATFTPLDSELNMPITDVNVWCHEVGSPTPPIAVSFLATARAITLFTCRETIHLKKYNDYTPIDQGKEANFGGLN